VEFLSGAPAAAFVRPFGACYSPADPHMSTAHESRKPAVLLEDVWRTYGSGSGAVDALRGVSLSFSAGTFHAVLGPSGSGKSTLLHVASGLDVPSRGRVTLLGSDVGRLGDADLSRLRRRSVGFVFQFFNLMPTLTVEENALLPVLLDRPVTRMDRDRLERLLDDLEIRRLRDRLPEELSGGERQRAAIARAMLPAPPILFADEPTGNLDSSTGLGIVQQLRAQVRERGLCLVVVTHDARIAEQADEIIELRDGRVAARGVTRAAASRP
jgi:putative ABC transport system ATP-binding protein